MLRSCSRRRFLAAATAALTVLGQLSSFAHIVVVRHFVCGQHGELVEVSPKAQAKPAHAPRVRTELTYHPAGESDHGHEHDHCLVAAHLRQRLNLSPDAAPLPDVSAGSGGAAPTADASPAALLAVYRLAPKNSPPV